MNTSDITAKRKFADLNTSNSSEGSASPINSPALKHSRSCETATMSITKDDLVQLRLDLKSDVKAELKEQLSKYVAPLVAKVDKLEAAVEALDRKSRANNIILHGIPSLQNESSDVLICYLNDFWKKLGLSQQVILDDVYRLGKASPSGSRPVLAKLLRSMDRKAILTKKKEAAKLKVYINVDCTVKEQFEKKLLSTHLRALKNSDGTVWGSIRGNSLHIKKAGFPTRKFCVEEGTVKELSP
jgi:citrate lyase gamma subunit